MGWTYTAKPFDVSKWLSDTLTWDSPTHVNKAIATAIVARTEAYAAVERIDKQTGERMVWAAAFMIRFVPRARDGYTFGYKDMDETCGPNIHRCTIKILDLLKPTGNEYANQWRRNCRSYHARRQAANRKAPPGAVLSFADPIRFTDGSEERNFIRLKGSTFVAYRPDTKRLFGRFRISGWRERNFNILPRDIVSEQAREDLRHYR